MLVINLNRLKAERIANDLSEAELAEKLGISPSIIYKYENGSRRISVETFCNIVDVLGFDESNINIFFMSNRD